MAFARLALGRIGSSQPSCSIQPLADPIETPLRGNLLEGGQRSNGMPPRALPTLSRSKQDQIPSEHPRYQAHNAQLRSNHQSPKVRGTSKYKHKFASLAPVSSNIRPQQPQGVGSHSGADKGMGTSFLFFSRKYYI